MTGETADSDIDSVVTRTFDSNDPKKIVKKLTSLITTVHGNYTGIASDNNDELMELEFDARGNGLRDDALLAALQELLGESFVVENDVMMIPWSSLKKEVVLNFKASYNKQLSLLGLESEGEDPTSRVTFDEPAAPEDAPTVISTDYSFRTDQFNETDPKRIADKFATQIIRNHENGTSVALDGGPRVVVITFGDRGVADRDDCLRNTLDELLLSDKIRESEGSLIIAWDDLSAEMVRDFKPTYRRIIRAKEQQNGGLALSRGYGDYFANYDSTHGVIDQEGELIKDSLDRAILQFKAHQEDSEPFVYVAVGAGSDRVFPVKYLYAIANNLPFEYISFDINSGGFDAFKRHYIDDTWGEITEGEEAQRTTQGYQLISAFVKDNFTIKLITVPTQPELKYLLPYLGGKRANLAEFWYGPINHVVQDRLQSNLIENYSGLLHPWGFAFGSVATTKRKIEENIEYSKLRLLYSLVEGESIPEAVLQELNALNRIAFLKANPEDLLDDDAHVPDAFYDLVDALFQDNNTLDLELSQLLAGHCHLLHGVIFESHNDLKGHLQRLLRVSDRENSLLERHAVMYTPPGQEETLKIPYKPFDNIEELLTIFRYGSVALQIIAIAHMHPLDKLLGNEALQRQESETKDAYTLDVTAPAGREPGRQQQTYSHADYLYFMGTPVSAVQREQRQDELQNTLSLTS